MVKFQIYEGLTTSHTNLKILPFFGWILLSKKDVYKVKFCKDFLKKFWKIYFSLFSFHLTNFRPSCKVLTLKAEFPVWRLDDFVYDPNIAVNIKLKILN